MVIGEDDRDLLIELKVEIKRIKEDLDEVFKEIKFYSERTNELQSSHNTIIHRLNELEDRFDCFEDEILKNIKEITGEFTKTSNRVDSFILFAKISAAVIALIVASLTALAAFLQI